MKRTFALAALLIAALTAGCRVADIVSINDPYDLKIQVWDVSVNGPYERARVTVKETGDQSWTGSDGWTDYLQTVNGDVVHVTIEWWDHCRVGHSYEVGVYLHHATPTTARYDVEPRCWH